MLPLRSSARLAAQASSSIALTNTNASRAVELKTPTRKRKPETTLTKENVKKVHRETTALVVGQPDNSAALGDEDVPAVLTFDFELAKKHLIAVDHRFENIFDKMRCKPFEELERVHPFRALTTSILSQQISWLAARSILLRFIRLYDPSVPEKPTDEERRAITFFPTPFQVANTDVAILRTAGLSARKAEYVKDLASRFVDGRLSTKKLLEATDEELAEMLIQVRGIGRWTVDMFAIFSLRRPDILPVGDLGVQRGLLRWFLSLYSPHHSFSISPERIGGSKEPGEGDDDLPSISRNEDNSNVVKLSSAPGGTELETEDLVEFPPAFTSSVKKLLKKAAVDSGKLPTPLPGLDIPGLKSRLDGKKMKGAFLTPQEMIALTECWKPYRSIGVYYMWSLVAAQ